MKSNLEYAAEVYWGEYIGVLENHIITTTTPEDILIQKQMIQSLSEEAREVLLILINSADKLLLKNGKVVRKNLEEFLKKEKHWKRKKVIAVLRELAKLNVK